VIHEWIALLHFNPLELHFEQLEFLLGLGPLGDGICVIRGYKAYQTTIFLNTLPREGRGEVLPSKKLARICRNKVLP
jgi:hypothetical protein